MITKMKHRIFAGLTYYLRPEEVIALCAFTLLTILSFLFDSSVNPTPYIFVMFVMLSPTFLIPMLVLRHRSFHQTLLSIVKILRDWAPVVCCLVIYENLHDMVHLINPNDFDQILLRLDELIFGIQPTIYLERFTTPFLSEFFYFSYMTYFFYPVLSLGVLYYQNREKAFRDLIIVIVLTLYIGFLGYLMVPAVGPQYTLADRYSTDIQGYALGSIQEGIDQLFRVPRDCFPSLHFSLSAVILFMAFRQNRWLFWLYLPFVICLWISTVFLRYHYVVDLIGGIPLIFFVLWIGPRLNLWWYKKGKFISDP